METGAGKTLVFVNGPSNSVIGPRARMVFGESATIVYKERGRIGSAPGFARALAAHKRGWIVVMDLGFPQAPMAAIRRVLSPDVRLAYDIGDPARPLLANQRRPAIEVSVAHAFDRWLPMAADHLIFRSSYMARYFEEIAPRHRTPPWSWVPDGADTGLFTPRRDDPAVAALRRKHGLEGKFVVGIVGTINHNPFFRLFYGWDLAGMLALTSDDPRVVGVVVGSGPGTAVLAAECERLNLGDRLRMIGRVPHDEVPLWMNVFDVALSTQTNDPVGWGRTTAKLPEYLACGTPVLATDVGEAHRWLSASGQTLPYEGMRDEGYPERLAFRVREFANRDLTPLREHNRALALRVFDYDVVRRKMQVALAEPGSTHDGAT